MFDAVSSVTWRCSANHRLSLPVHLRVFLQAPAEVQENGCFDCLLTVWASHLLKMYLMVSVTLDNFHDTILGLVSCKEHSTIIPPDFPLVPKEFHESHGCLLIVDWTEKTLVCCLVACVVEVSV